MSYDGVAYPAWADDGALHDALTAEAAADWEAQHGPVEYPRGDWSGDPETFYTHPMNLGGDLPPGHVWLELPIEERARLWAEGHRPWMYDSRMGPDDEGMDSPFDAEGWHRVCQKIEEAVRDFAETEWRKRPRPHSRGLAAVGAPSPGPSACIHISWDALEGVPPDAIALGNVPGCPPGWIATAYPDGVMCCPPPPAPHQTGAGSVFAGWSQPPHPIDVIPSFDPHASHREQARSVLYDYYHDDPLRYWSDNEAVKRCFIGGKDPRKENHDPTLLIAAYENKHHPVWKCSGTGMTWADLDQAVNQAIAHRKKLGPLPKSQYDTSKGPVVIYYYDNDKMKRITYPPMSIPQALNPNNVWWFKWGQGDSSDAGKAAGLDDIHTRETDDPKKIQVERENPGWTTKDKKTQLKKKYSWLSDMDSGSAGDWQSEGVTWDKDMIGVVGAITGVVLALVSAVLDATGVGAIVGVPLGVATPFIVAAINAVDAGLHAGDFGAAMNSLGPMLVQAAVQATLQMGGEALQSAGVTIPPEALKALGQTIGTLAKTAMAGQKKGLDFGQIWSQVAAKSKSMPKIDDAAAHAIAQMLGGKDESGTTKRIFINGYEAGKLTDPATMGAIAKIMESWKQFGDPRVINIFLLGAGFGHVARAQGVGTTTHATHATKGGSSAAPEDALRAFALGTLIPRYSGSVSTASPVLTSGAYDFVDDVHADGRTERCQQLLNDLRGCRPGDALFLEESGVLDVPTRQAVRNFQFEAGVGPCDGTPTDDTLAALEVEMGHKRDVFLGRHMVGQTSLQPEPDFGPLSRGCPTGTWFDPFTGTCRQASAPLPPRPQPMPLPQPQPTPMPLPGPAAPVPSVQGDFDAWACPGVW